MCGPPNVRHFPADAHRLLEKPAPLLAINLKAELEPQMHSDMK
jgi:hypothetical protein